MTVKSVLMSPQGLRPMPSCYATVFQSISTRLKFDFQYHSFMYLFFCVLSTKESSFKHYSVPVKHEKPPRYF